MATTPARTSGRPRHIPQRTCIACRTTSAKRGLVRIVRTPDGRAVIDPTGKLSGRGAYLCTRRACWDEGLKRDRLARALKTTIAAEDRQALADFAASLPVDDGEND